MSEEGAHHHWVKTQQTDVFRTWHIWPVDDVIDHEAEECPCYPVTKPVPYEDGGVGWVLHHNALDGRTPPNGVDSRDGTDVEQGVEDTKKWKLEHVGKEFTSDICANCKGTIYFWHCTRTGCCWCASCGVKVVKKHG